MHLDGDFFAIFFLGRELKVEISRLKNLIKSQIDKNKELDLEIENKRREHQMNLYCEYLKGLLADNSVSPDEFRKLQQ